MRLSAILGCLILLTAACAQTENEPEPRSEAGPLVSGETELDKMRREAWEKIDKEACEDKGGVVRAEGLLGLPRCVLFYSDAGKKCQDASDCEGRCLSRDGITDYSAAPGKAFGACEENDSPFGCYAIINDGTLSPTLCVD